MDKNMILYRFMKGKTWWITKSCETLIYNGENNGNITKQW